VPLRCLGTHRRIQLVLWSFALPSRVSFHGGTCFGRTNETDSEDVRELPVLADRSASLARSSAFAVTGTRNDAIPGQTGKLSDPIEPSRPVTRAERHVRQPARAQIVVADDPVVHGRASRERSRWSAGQPPRAGDARKNVFRIGASSEGSASGARCQAFLAGFRRSARLNVTSCYRSGYHPCYQKVGTPEFAVRRGSRTLHDDETRARRDGGRVSSPRPRVREASPRDVKASKRGKQP